MHVAFGDFVFDGDTRELRRGDQTVHLSPKAFQLLEILVENRPRAVSKTDLMARLWPDTYVVEKNLANMIGEIRDAIGDSPSEPVFVRTIHRFGYAFRAPPAAPGAQGSPAVRGVGKYRLVWSEGRAVLDEGEYVLGRDRDVELFLDSSSVSRRHALIRASADGVTIQDLGSKNGTFIGDRRIDSAAPLSDGDTIAVGSIKLAFHVVRARGSTETASAVRRSTKRVDGFSE